MKRPGSSYTGYSIGVGVVWAVRLILVGAFGSKKRFNNNLLVFSGFAIGWLSATIARYVYPPPKMYRQAESQPS